MAVEDGTRRARAYQTRTGPQPRSSTESRERNDDRPGHAKGGIIGSGVAWRGCRGTWEQDPRAGPGTGLKLHPRSGPPTRAAYGTHPPALHLATITVITPTYS